MLPPPVSSSNFPQTNAFPDIVQKQFRTSLSDTTEKNWSKFFTDDLSRKLESYKSSLPENILSRPEQVLAMMACLGVERVDLPKLPNGQPVKWWYFVQFKNCSICLYFSKKDTSPTKRSCQNPKVSKDDFFVYSSSLDICPHWRAGYDNEVIEEKQSAGSNEALYIWASLIALGICDKPNNQLLPLVGIPQIFRATPEVLHAADLYNQNIYDYLQLYYLKQAGYRIDNHEFDQLPLVNLPIMKAENFDTNAVQSGMVM